MNEIARRDTVAAIVSIYNRARRETTAAYRLLHRSEEMVRAHVYQYARLSRANAYAAFDDDALAAVLADLKAQTWHGIIDRLNVRGVMDSKRRAELDKQLETGDGLPDITTDAVLDVIAGMLANVNDYARSAIREAFDLIRRKSEGYKSTGQAWSVTNKAVLGWMVEHSYSQGCPFRLSYRATDDARTIETAFRMLDGRGPLQAHTAEFAGVLNSSTTGEGETEYFRFRAHHNGNLHLWFKRADLVAQLNAVAGGDPVLRKPVL